MLSGCRFLGLLCILVLSLVNLTLQLHAFGKQLQELSTHIHATTQQSKHEDEKPSEHISKKDFPLFMRPVRDNNNQRRYPYDYKELNLADKSEFVLKKENLKHFNNNPFSLYKTRFRNKIHNFGRMNNFGSEKEFYPGAFPYYLRSPHFGYNDFGRNVFHPYLYKMRKIHPNEDVGFMNRRYVDDITLDDEAYPANRHVKTLLKDDIPSSDAPTITKASNTTKDSSNNNNNNKNNKRVDTEKIPLLQFPKSDNNDLKRDIAEKIDLKPEYVPQDLVQTELEDRFSADNLSDPLDESHILEYMIGDGDPKSSEEFDNILSIDEREADINTTTVMMQTTITRHSEKIDPRIENLMIVSNERIFYEKVPPNLNLSWYVYVNCSRERCQLTNTTNETELVNEGWVLHNCTSKGCEELYPRRESLQRFIGLMLLVFSLCVLKIVVFLLIFYYCRRIKLTKQQAEEEGRSKDAETTNFSNREYQKLKNDDDIGIDYNGRKQISQKPIDNVSDQEQLDGNVSPSHKIPDISNLVGDQANNSKVWNPPTENISTCLVAPTIAKDIRIPNKFIEKIQNSEDLELWKSRKRKHSRIPRLSKLMKTTKESATALKSNKGEDSQKPIEFNANQNQDLLLLNLDDDNSSNEFFTIGNTNQISSWDPLFENE